MNRDAHNMGFGAMAADEYILIVPFAAQLWSQRNEFFDSINNNQLTYLYQATVPG